MRLADFILQDIDGILAEWETFAVTLLPAAEGMSSLALRDHAHQILQAIVKDISEPQTREAQSQKSKGRAPIIAGAPETAAQTHAVLRARGGFDIKQLVAEYRALRASVLGRWIDHTPLEKTDLDDIMRFNEAIDQAVAESVGHFHAQVERARNLLLGMLGHDMRSPLNTIVVTAAYLSRLDAGDDVSAAAARLIHSGASMKALLDDLMDFNRTRLGLGLKIVRSDIDLAVVVQDELEQLRGANPSRRIELATTGDCRGRWDGVRLQQLLRNLVVNAIRYGYPDEPIRVVLRGGPSDVHLEVLNSGPSIDPSIETKLFEPLERGEGQVDDKRPGAGLGLGLFIVREIVKAHGGEVEARSDEGQTAFIVHLPR